MEWGWGSSASTNSQNSVELDYEAQQLLETRSKLEKADDDLYADADFYFQQQEVIRLSCGREGTVDDTSNCCNNSVTAENESTQLNIDDPQEAAKLWFKSQEESEKLPLRAWTTNFPFMRIVGHSISPPFVSQSSLDAEEIFAEDDTRSKTKELLIQNLLKYVLNEMDRRKGKEEMHGVRVASVTKYVAGGRG